MSAEALETGYRGAYREFYQWSSIFQGAWTKPDWAGKIRHLAYAGGWKKFEPLWDWVIRLHRVSNFLPLLESVLEGFSKQKMRPEIREAVRTFEGGTSTDQ
jgi:hypothetical protein